MSAIRVINAAAVLKVDNFVYNIEVSKELQKHLMDTNLISLVTVKLNSLVKSFEKSSGFDEDNQGPYDSASDAFSIEQTNELNMPQNSVEVNATDKELSSVLSSSPYTSSLVSTNVSDYLPWQVDVLNSSDSSRLTSASLLDVPVKSADVAPEPPGFNIGWLQSRNYNSWFADSADATVNDVGGPSVNHSNIESGSLPHDALAGLTKSFEEISTTAFQYQQSLLSSLGLKQANEPPQQQARPSYFPAAMNAAPINQHHSNGFQSHLTPRSQGFSAVSAAAPPRSGSMNHFTQSVSNNSIPRAPPFAAQPQFYQSRVQHQFVDNRVVHKIEPQYRAEPQYQNRSASQVYQSNNAQRYVHNAHNVDAIVYPPAPQPAQPRPIKYFLL